MGKSLSSVQGNILLVQKNSCSYFRGGNVRAALLFLIAAFSGGWAEAQVTFAGTQFNIAGDTLASPSGVAVDGKGNVYVADKGNNRILSVTPSTNGTGVVATVLDGLSAPAGIAADWSGNLFVADTGNNRILMLPMAKGVLGTPVPVASGFSGPTGVALDASDNLYVADTGNNQIVELPRVGNTYGSPLLVMSGLSSPNGVAIDAVRNIYIADTGNNRVVKLVYSAAGYLTQQVLGRGLTAPMGVAVDPSYNVYIADTGNNRIVEEPWFAGAKRYNSQVIVGSDAAKPAGVVRDWSGNVYVADLGNNQVLEIVNSSINFGAFNVGSNGSIQTYNFNIAAGTVIGGVNIYMQGATGKDFVDAGGTSCIAQTYDTATACGVNVSFKPMSSGLRSGAVVIVDPQGNVLVTAFISGSDLLARMAFLPGTRTVIATQLSGPSGVAVDGTGNVYIADTGNNRVLEMPTGGNGSQAVLPISGLNNPMGLAVDGAGNLYVVSNGNDKVVKLPWMGAGFGVQTKVGAGFYGPTETAVDSNGGVYVADTLDQFVFRLPWSGSSFGSGQHLGGYVKCPQGVAIDAMGSVYFTMPYLNSLIKIPLIGGQYQPQVQIPLLRVSFPSAIAIDGNSNIYVLDSGNNRVVMLPWNGSSYGTQITVAVGFNAPGGMTVDVNGNLYVADTGNNQVVRIDLSTPQSLSFADTYLGSTSTDSAQVISLQNTGNLPLELSSLTFAVDFPADLNATNPCSESVSTSQGSACQLAIDFKPTLVGTSLSESILLSANGAGSQQSISVNGSSFGKATQSITFPTITDVSYGVGPIVLSATSSAGLPITYQVVSGPAVLNSGGKSITVNGTGNVVVQAMQSGSATYGAASSVMCSFQVFPAVLTVVPVNITTTYRAVPTTFSYTVSGFVAGQNASQVLTGKAVVSSSAGASADAGRYVLSVTQGTLSAVNYSFVFSTGTMTVSKASLVIRAASTTNTYGTVIPSLGWTVSGYVGGDAPGVVQGAPAMTTAANRKSAVGNYAITASLGTLSAANYSFTFVGGTLSIVQAKLLVSVNSQTFVYGGIVPKMTYTISGFVTGDTATTSVTGAPNITVNATSLSGVGSYSANASLGSLSAQNYSFGFVPGVVLITKAMLSVTPANASMTYGGKPPVLTYVITGYVGLDTQAKVVSGTAVLKTLATSATKPGSVAIIAMAGSLSAKNYNFVCLPGVLTIRKAMLTVQVKAASITYGARMPGFQYEFNGFVNGDGVGSIKGAPALSTTAVTGAKVGSYSITGADGTLNSKLYDFQIVGSRLTITKAVLTVVPDAASIVYGQAMPVLTYKIKGFLNADTNAMVSGKPQMKTTASVHAHVGSYPLQVGIGTLAAVNYSFAVTDGLITVRKAIATIVVDHVGMVYGSVLPALTYKIKGLVSGDKISAIAGRPTLQTSADAGSHAGLYAIHVSVGSLTSPDYSFAFVDAALAVNKAVLVVTPDKLMMTYGGSLPAFTYKLSGFVGKDTPLVVSGLPVLTTTASSNSIVGVYPLQVGVGTLVAENYTFKLATGQVAVNKAVLTVTPNTSSMIYGGKLPKFTYTVTGLVNGDSARVVNGLALVTSSGSSSSAVGNYDLIVNVAQLSAKNYSLVAAQGTFTVNKAVLTVTADNQSMNAGATVPALTYSATGLMNGDTVELAASGAPALATTVTTTSTVGSYPITAAQGTMQSANYTLSFANGKLTVN